MARPKNFQLADYGSEVEDLENNQGSRLFRPVDIVWSRPRVWVRGENAPIPSGVGQGCLYAILRDHHRAKSKDAFAYVGITGRLDRRFNNHPKAKLLSAMRGETTLSIGVPDFRKYNTAKSNAKPAIEELEHILIWALWPTYNERKWNSLPGMGVHPGRAWQIFNGGYRFSGTMPREIVYPWMAVKLGRNRSVKPSANSVSKMSGS